MDGRYNDWNGAYSAVFTSLILSKKSGHRVNSIDASAGRGSGRQNADAFRRQRLWRCVLFEQELGAGLSGWFQNLVAPEDFQQPESVQRTLGGPIKRTGVFFLLMSNGRRKAEASSRLC
jgi:hypothetical protein